MKLINKFFFASILLATILSATCIEEKSGDIFEYVRFEASSASEDSSVLTFLNIRGLIEDYPLSNSTFRHKFRAALPHCDDQKAMELWEALKVKAREPEHFVEVINDCKVINETVPFGFIRQPIIVVPEQEPFSITEHVLLSDSDKTVMFIQTDGDFLAINRLEKVGNQWYLDFNYVYNFPKTSAL